MKYIFNSGAKYRPFYTCRFIIHYLKIFQRNVEILTFCFSESPGTPSSSDLCNVLRNKITPYFNNKIIFERIEILKSCYKKWIQGLMWVIPKQFPSLGHRLNGGALKDVLGIFGCLLFIRITSLPLRISTLLIILSYFR